MKTNTTNTTNTQKYTELQDNNIKMKYNMKTNTTNTTTKINTKKPTQKSKGNGFKTFTLEVQTTQKCNLGCPRLCR